MKRLWLILCAAACLTAVLTGTALAAETVDSGTCGEGLTWTLYDDGRLNINGSGAMEDMTEGQPWRAFLEQIKTVNVGYSVKSIGAAAFKDCTALESVILPDGLLDIGSEAFNNCRVLPKLDLPGELQSVGEAAFEDCRALTGLLFPDGLEDIPAAVCRRCWALEVLGLSENLKSIGDAAFDDCRVLPSVILPDGIEKVPENAFRDCFALTAIELSESLSEIASGAFENCRTLPYLELPTAIKTIGEDAFRGCDELSDVTFAGEEEQLSQVEIKDRTFEGLPIRVLIRRGVVMSQRNGGMYTYEPDEGEPVVVWSFYEGGLLNVSWVGETNLTNKPQVGYHYQAKEEPWNDFRDEVTRVVSDRVRIGGYLFMDLPNLQSVKIIGTDIIGDGAFMDCPNLQSVVVPYGVTWIGGSVFKNDAGLTSVKLPETVESSLLSVFNGCTSLKTVNIPKKVEVLNDIFTNCSSLEEIDIPDAVTSIGGFKGCTSLKSIELPDNVTTIYDGAFEGCTALESVKMPPAVTKMGRYIFRNCSSLAELAVPAGVKKLGASMFDGCTALRSVTLSEGLETIDQYAFRNSGVGTLTLPDSVTAMETNCLNNCNALTELNIGSGFLLGQYQRFTSLASTSSCPALQRINVSEDNANYTSVDGIVYDKDKTTVLRCPAAWSGSLTLPESVTTIGEDAFYNCKAVTKVVMREGVQAINSSGFESCTALKEVILPVGLRSIGYQAFDGSGLERVSVPDSVTELGKEVFDHCRSLKIARLGSGIGTLPNYTFSFCEALEQIFLPRGLTEIGNEAMSLYNSICDIYFAGTREEWQAVTGREAAEHYIRNIYYLNGENDDGVMQVWGGDEENVLTVTVDLEALKLPADTEAEVWCAFYDESGRYLGMETPQALSDAENGAMTFQKDDEAAQLRFFLLGEGCTPLCGHVTA